MGTLQKQDLPSCPQSSEGRLEEGLETQEKSQQVHEKQKMLEMAHAQKQARKNVPQTQEMQRHRLLHDEERLDQTLPPEMLVVQKTLRPRILNAQFRLSL